MKKLLLWLWPKIRWVYGLYGIDVNLAQMVTVAGAIKAQASGAHAAHGDGRGERVPGAHALLIALLCAASAQAAPSPDALNAVHNAFRGYANPFRMGEPLASNDPQGGGTQSGPSFRFDGSYNLLVNCITGCSASSGFTDNSTFTVGSSTINPIGALYSTSTPSISSGNAGRVRMDSSSYLFVDCVVGCSASAGFSDNSAFTAGTTAISLTGGWYSASPTNCTSGNACAPQLTLDRKLFVQDFQGTSPWVVSANGGSFAVTQSGTWTVQPGNTANTTAWLVTGTGGTFPATQSGTWNVGLSAGSNTVGKVDILGNAGGTLDSSGQNQAPTNWLTAGCNFFTSPTTITNTQGSPLGCDNADNLLVKVNVALPAGSAVIGKFGIDQTTPGTTNAVSATNFPSTVDTNTGNASASTIREALATNNPAIAAWGQGATGSAVPSGAVQVGGNGSGNLTVPPVCDSTVIKNAFSTSGSTQIVAAPGAGKNTYICGFAVNGASATLNTVKLVYGTKTTNDCDTGANDLSAAVPIQAPASVAPAGQNVAPPSNTVWKTGATNNQVCVNLSAAQAVNLQVWYTSF